MKLTHKTINLLVAVLLLLGTIGIGALAYRQTRAQADTILPGFATARVFMEFSVPEAKVIQVRATFNPVYPKNQRFYYKDRVFKFNPGTTTINWFIRKIPADMYNVSITSTEGNLEPATLVATLQSDRVNGLDKVKLFLGLPEYTPTPASVEPTATPTPTPASIYTPDSYEFEGEYTPEPSTTGTSGELPATPPVPPIPT